MTIAGHTQATLSYSGVDTTTQGEHDRVDLSAKEQQTIDAMEQQFQQKSAKNHLHKPKKHHSRFTKFIIDLAYTMNHALVCTATDPITDVPISHLVNNLVLKQGESWDWEDLHPKSIGAEAKKSFITGTGDAVKWATRREKELSEEGLGTIRFYASEIMGDFGAVPLTVAIRHYAPFVSKAIHAVGDPIARPIFMRRAEKAALKDIGRFTHSGNEEEIKTSDAFKTRRDEIFKKEFDNYPNGVLWTVASPAINISLQFALDKVTLRGKSLKDPLYQIKDKNGTPTGKEHSFTRMLGARVLGKTIGAVTTSTLTFGLRAAAPSKMQTWDNKMEKLGGKIVSHIGRPFGIKKETIKEGMEELREKDPEHHSHHKEPYEEYGRWTRAVKKEATEALAVTPQRG